VNQELQEITDPTFKQLLMSNLNLSQNDKLVNQPCILGSVTGGFDRKLKMIDITLFSLLSISDNPKLIPAIHSSTLKEGVLNILKTSNNSNVYKVDKYLKGWQSIFEHKVKNNQLQDIMAVNCPEEVKE
jgi:hypothetical protein